MPESSKRTYTAYEERLVKAIPEAATDYEEFVSKWGDEDVPHVFFGDILNSRISRLLQEGTESQLEEIFQLIEDMATSGDDAIQNVVAVTICEYISGWDLLHLAWAYMGPATRRTAHAMAVAWGHPLPEEREQLTESDRARYRMRFNEELERLGREPSFQDIPKITRLLISEFGLTPYFPIEDFGEQ